MAASNKRRQYRVTETLDLSVDIELVRWGTMRYQVDLLDISSGGAGLEAPPRIRSLVRRN